MILRLGPSPGGSPGSCSNGRVGFTCAECPRGTFASLEGRCAQCAEGNQALWMTLGCEMIVMLEDKIEIAGWFGLICWNVMYLYFFLVPCDVFVFLFQRYWIYRGKWSTTSSSTLGYSLRFWLCFNKGDVMLFSMGTRAILVVCFSSNSRLFRGEQENTVRTSWGYRKRVIKPSGTQPTNSMTGQQHSQIPGHQDLTFLSPKIGTFFCRAKLAKPIPAADRCCRFFTMAEWVAMFVGHILFLCHSCHSCLIMVCCCVSFN